MLQGMLHESTPAPRPETGHAGQVSLLKADSQRLLGEVICTWTGVICKFCLQQSPKGRKVNIISLSRQTFS